MENPLGDMPSLEPTNKLPEEDLNQATPEVPAEKAVDVAADPEVHEKKPFFTMGKILAIFGVLLIVGTVVGAVLYSRSAERLQGNIVTLDKSDLIINRSTLTTDNATVTTLDTAKNVTSTDNATTTTNLSTAENLVSSNDAFVATMDTNRVIATIDDSAKTAPSKCDASLNRIPSSGTSDAFLCVCEDGFVSNNATDACVEIDYCKITEDELSSYFGSVYTTPATEKIIMEKLGGAIGDDLANTLAKYQDLNCKVDLITVASGLRDPITKLSIPEVKELTCAAPLVKQTDATTGTDYCMCPIQQYPWSTLSTGVAAAPVLQTQCLPYKCDITQEELKKVGTDMLSLLNKQNLSTQAISSITAKFSSDYRAWMDKTCPKETVVTCDDLKDDLSTAYYAKNWDEYNSVLDQMQTLKCFSPCELLLYKAVMYMSQNQVAEARKLVDQFMSTCTDECTLTYGMMSLYADTLSRLEQNVSAANPVSQEDLARLKQLVVNYIEKCQCFEIESFLTAPGFTAGEFFPRTNAGIRTAYAQSLSPTVRGVIEGVFNDLCVPEKTPGDEPKSCSTLTITSPSSTGSFQITEDFDPATDYLKFNVDNDELVTGYKISSQTIVFDGDANNIGTTQMEVSMDGGPEAGSEDVITVTALEGSSNVVTHVVAPKETCSASIKIVRPPEVPPVDQEPVCRLLEIVSPGDAAEPGVPTIELPEGEYSNKVLEIKVSADAGSVKDYKYATANGYITFNGEETLYTADKTVIMEGVIPEGETETISVWARDPDLKGIQTCNDGYIINVPKEDTPPPVIEKTPPPVEETPPPVEKTPPPVTVTEEEPPPVIKETYVPPTTVVVKQPETVIQPVHQAAPEAPKTGPGVLIYLVGAGFGGALLRKKKN